MDMCDGCVDRQQWLLDSGDGSQVICLCQIKNNQAGDDKVTTLIDVGVQTSEITDRQQSLFKADDESQSKAECENCGHKFSRPDSLKRHQNYSCKIKNNAREESQQSHPESGDGNNQVEDDEITTTIDVTVQTPKRMTPPINITNAPKRKKQKMNRKFWMNSGCDIRRNLFRDHDLEVVKRVQDRKWAILKIESIATSLSHQCIRRFYLGDKDGRNYLEMEFYPCILYKDLGEKYKELFHEQKSSIHGLNYNPIKRVLPCKMAISKINDFIVYNNIQTILYNNDYRDGNIEFEMCERLRIHAININFSFNHLEIERHG